MGCYSSIMLRKNQFRMMMLLLLLLVLLKSSMFCLTKDMNQKV